MKTALAILGAVLSAGLVVPAWAQEPAAEPVPAPGPEPALDEAEQLFRAGVKAYEEGRVAEAEGLFARALELRKASDIASNLATAQLEQGKFRLAATHFQLALDTLPAGAHPDRKKALIDQFAKAKAKVMTLRLSVNVEAKVRIDAEPPLELKPGPAKPVFLDPGDHRVVVESRGYGAHEEAIAAIAGAEMDRTVALEPTEGPSAAPIWPPIVAGTVGVLGLGALGAAIGLLVVGSGQADDARTLAEQHAQAGDCSAAAPCNDILEAFADADTLYNASMGLFIGGGALIVGASVFLVVAYSGDAEAQIVPILSPTTAGLLFNATF